MKKNRKEELLDLAYNLFITKGYDNTSVDEIIEKANMAKGTYYYYFTSKEEMLDQVIDNMFNKELIEAKKILNMPLPIEQKLIGVITSLRPTSDEVNIVDALNNEKNIIMHSKYNKRLIDEASILIKEIVLEGINNGIFECNNIEERIRFLLIMSNELFDNKNFTEKDVEVFIDAIEKMLGAKKGSMNFVKNLIGGYNE